ncbi:MAG: class I SAM-dependent methyltransferase [Bacilli bacterium]|nr:class I SAM-dependent methyltransferase [Bacilli bacterium]
MKISKRLLKIASMVPLDIPCADIGSDHGLLVKYLLDNNLVPFCYASDNKKGPFERLKKNLSTYISQNKVEVDLVDGIKNLTNKYKTIIIAGMGGDLIKEILEKEKDKLKNIEYLLLSPHGKEKELREFLTSNQFQIIDENVVYEDHYYEIILFKKSPEIVNYSTKQLEYGPINLIKKDETFINKYQDRIISNTDLLNNHQLNHLRIQEIKETIIKDKNILKELNC